ncbi:Cellulose synthase OS=Streptomyces alboniger OX=132473 GN=CP975_05815 PE=4 SV=1 [Streptomyces alboniger]
MIAETICSAVSAAGLGIAAVTAYRKRFLTAARLAAYALVPVGLVLTGVVGWAADTAFSLRAWVGFGVLGAAWLIFLGTRAVERRSGGTRKERKAAKAARREAVAPAASAPSLGQGARPAAATPAAKPKSAAPAEDFSDIEAILKKHGI